MRKPGIEISVSERSPLWEPFTDGLFEKKDGVWTKRAGQIEVENLITVICGEAQVGYRIASSGVNMEYSDRLMMLSAEMINPQENYEHSDMWFR